MARAARARHREIGCDLRPGCARGLLRFITCGSVDDGKSTLIGRLLYEFEIAVRGPAGGADRRFAQGRRAPRASSISACCSTGWRPSASRASPSTSPTASSPRPRRKFIVADTPGHEQYTRNMVTGASTADAAVILIDARKGVLTQTRRHSYLVSLLGIRHMVLAINKMDLVDWDEQRFDAIRDIYRQFAGADWASHRSSRSRPPRRTGDNITSRSARTPWYQGPDPDGVSRDGRGRRGPAAGTRRSVCRCNGSTARTWISAVSPG